MRKVLLALNHCHANEIIHRDIKPHNILCSENGEVKIIDFGLAERNSPDKKLIAGTPMYIAPEVLSNFYGKECDMWSLGITLNFLLTGEPVFDAEDCDGLYYKIKRGKYTLSSSLSKGARDLISKMLVSDPTKRITASEAL